MAPAKRSGNYTQQEDIQLCKSWQSISMDPIIGNEQPGRAYWKRIADHYHENRDFESDRNANSLEHRWSALQKHCMKFQACFEQVERRHPSGVPYKEHVSSLPDQLYKLFTLVFSRVTQCCISSVMQLIESQELYNSTNHNRSFQYVHCWIQVRNNEKFQSLGVTTKKSKSSSPSEGE